MKNLPNIYTFDDFRFDADKLALYHKNRLVNTDKKTMQVLAVLLLNPNKLTAHDEIIERVWQDNPLGVTTNHIGQYISKLRKVFAEYAPETSYIENVKGRGYLFIGDVAAGETETVETPKDEPSEFPPVLPEAGEKSGSAASSRRIFQKPVLILLASAAILLFGLLAWNWFSENDEEEIRRVVKEAQLYESLALYRNPSAFREEDLDKYWTNELDNNVNLDRHRIRDAVKKLRDEGRRYGDETKCEQFEFQTVEVNQNKNFAVVKTLEKWFIAAYFSDGTLQKNKTVGPYFVSYILRKDGGRWLIEKSTTARVSRPTPRLSEITAISEIKAGQQFLARVTGQDFEAETVYLEIVGEGCPESKPCKVPNSALRENSKLSDTVLENVPMTLASGDFRITARNGESQPSNPVSLKVP